VARAFRNDVALFMGLTGLAGYDLWRFGLLVESARAGNSDAGCSSAAALLGIAPSFGPLRWGALATLGGHHYYDIGSGIDEKDSATVTGDSAFIGTRLGAVLEFSGNPHFELGGWFVYETDLSRYRVSLPSDTYPRSAGIGSQRLGALLALGIGFTRGTRP
jgi:hypothetical protein